MKKRLLSLLLAAACLMPLSGCNWGEEPEETYDTLSQYYQQSDSTKQDTRLTTFGPALSAGGDMDPSPAPTAPSRHWVRCCMRVFTRWVPTFCPSLVWRRAPPTTPKATH